MANRAWKHWVIASILAVALWAAGPSKAEEKAQPEAFNSAVAFNVYAVHRSPQSRMRSVGYPAFSEEHQLVGRTPSERPLITPACEFWCSMPLPPVDMEKVCQAVEAQKIPGLTLPYATDADLEHLKGLTGLQDLTLGGTQVTDAGLEHLENSLPNVEVPP